MKADRIIPMGKFKGQDLLLICKKLGISAGTAIIKEAFPGVVKVEHVTIEEAHEAWETIIKRKKKQKSARGASVKR